MPRLLRAAVHHGRHGVRLVSSFAKVRNAILQTTESRTCVSMVSTCVGVGLRYVLFFFFFLLAGSFAICFDLNLNATKKREIRPRITVVNFCSSLVFMACCHVSFRV